MRNIIKMAAVAYVTGIACKAGMQLWDRVLSKKVDDLTQRVKTVFKREGSS